jgi:ubiquinone/menaquinone biosynthesis C-methylase UbiE
VVVRYGGDEFLILLRDVSESAATQRALNLSRDFAMNVQASSRIPTTFAFGVAAFRPGELAQAIAAADRRLYEHKGLLLPVERGSDLILTAAGRRALWQPMVLPPRDGTDLSVIVQEGQDPKVLQAFTAFIHPASGSSAVEVNAGHGRLGILGGLAHCLQPGGQYLAADFSGDHLGRLAKSAQGGQNSSGVHFLLASSDHLPIVSQTADLTVAAFALPVRQTDRSLREMRRVTRLSGRLAIAFVSSAVWSADFDTVWPEEGRPQAFFTASEFIGKAHKMHLHLIREQSYCGSLHFDQYSQAVEWRDAYIAAGPDAWRTIHGQKLFGQGQFVYQPATDTFDCPAHHPLTHHGDRHEDVGGEAVRMVGIYRGDRTTCGACPLKDPCLTTKQSTKHLTRGADDAVRDAMKAKVRSAEGNTVYRRRKGIVEPVLGILKETLGFRQWSLRSLKKVTGEWALLVMAYNIRKRAAKLRQLGDEAPAVWQGTRPVAA